MKPNMAEPNEQPGNEAAPVVASPSGTNHLSLEGMHGTVDVPPVHAGFWQQWRAFVGPAILVIVGYMDP